MEQYFMCIADMRGYDDFEREAWGFKVQDDVGLASPALITF
jgi:hypothetical protein